MSYRANDDNLSGDASRDAESECSQGVQVSVEPPEDKVYLKVTKGGDAEEVARQLIEELFPLS